MCLGLQKTIGLEASIEAALGMLRVDAIAFSSRRLEALVFGVADYGASLTMKTRGVSGHGEGRRNSIRAIAGIIPSAEGHGGESRRTGPPDAPYGDYRDEAGLRRSSGLGYDGKWVIHPSQLQGVNEMFTPSSEDVERSSMRMIWRRGRGGAPSPWTEDWMPLPSGSRVVCSQWAAIERTSRSLGDAFRRSRSTGFVLLETLISWNHR